ncbi:MAG TPA: flagellar hook capping FlgD N-terminal domain-containing protein [Solirubrobacteraceae bacterium]|jgi:flagellar basal-body rod modification protein FlgD|nr:flagellar hook capping FlgD N-terminal domain-containing protein [Solirubrobacteraceae bacterium]
MTATPLTAAPAATGAGSTGASQATPENPDGVLGQNDFLKLMVAQLQSQNPLEPSNPNEFINETEQMTMVEQITDLANSNELSGAVQMIGHNVTYDNAAGEVATGTVQSVQSNSAGTTVTVEGVGGVKLSAITNVE